MRWKLLARVLWGQYKKPLLIAAALGVIGTTALTFSTSSCPSRRACPCAHRAPVADSQSALFDRVWFDRYPEAPRDELAVWVYLSEGVGVFQQGSAFRGAFDVFELQREGDALELRWLQDESVDRTRFTVEGCDELPPFDLCLTLETPARGPARYYAMSDESAAAAQFPWVARMVGQARAAARAPR